MQKAMITTLANTQFPAEFSFGFLASPQQIF